MSHKTESTSLEIMRQRLQEKQAQLRKQAKADEGGVADPNLQGYVTPPVDPNAVNARNQLPAQGTGAPAAPQTNLNEHTRPGQNSPVPGTDSQNARDNAAKSPTENIAKIAHNIRHTQALLSGRAQPSAAKTAGQAGGWDPQVLAKMASELGTTPEQLSYMTPEQLAMHTREKLASVAAACLAVEEGADTMAYLLRKKAGTDECRKIISEAVNSYALMHKQASYEEEQYASEQYQIQLAQKQAAQALYELTKNASVDDINAINAYGSAIDRARHEFLEVATPDVDGYTAFVNGLKQAAADAEMLEQGHDPTQHDGPDSTEGDENGIGSELEQALAQAIQEGKLTPEQAAQLMQQLQTDVGGQDTPDQDVEEDYKQAAAGLNIRWSR